MLVSSWKVAALVVGQVMLVPSFLRGKEQLVTLRQAPDVPLFEFTMMPTFNCASSNVKCNYVIMRYDIQHSETTIVHCDKF